MHGKISRLPNQVREQLNQRLLDGELGNTLLPWLNSLPETQSVLAAHFKDKPISEQNLSDYRKYAFRRWQIRQAALDFAAEQVADLSPSSQAPAASPLVDHLTHWIATRFAAAAQLAPIPEDPQADLHQIRTFLSDITALRRGDLAARRLSLEQQRLAILQTKSQSEMEKLFWEWTKRPDIHAKLYPNIDPDKARLDVIRLLDQHLLGAKISSLPQESDPTPFASSDQDQHHVNQSQNKVEQGKTR